MKTKNTHGGKRKGAGRKKKDNVPISIRVSKRVLDRIAEKYTNKERNQLIIDYIETI